MNRRKLLFSFCLLLTLIFSIQIYASAASGSWKTVNGKKYYYTSAGKKYTGGPKTIGGKKYLFTSTGELITNKVTYYNKKVYVSNKSGVLLTKWGTVNGKTYYGTSAGYVKTGLQKYKNEYYYFQPRTATMVKSKWMTIGKYTYYFAKNGKAGRNRIQTIGGYKYYFDASAHCLTGVRKVGSYYYAFGLKTRKMLYGWQVFGKYKYYFNKSTGRAVTGWKTISGKRYYFNAQGHRQTGWYVSGSKKYYLDPNNNGAQVYGTKKINGKTYKFGTKGYVTYNKSSSSIVVRVNRAKNVVTVYENNVPIKAMTCSTGRSGHATPTGTFIIRDHLAWWYLDGPSMGQYCSHFLSEYLFHSVPVYGTSRNPYGVSSANYNKLGSRASAGCIRLCVADAKWIYTNVPIGSTVIISDNEPTPLGKPAVVKMPANTVGADPTDDFKNPGGYDVSIRK